MKHIFFGIIFVFFQVISIQAQEEIMSISKEEVLEKVKKNNRSIKISEQELNQVKAMFYQTNSLFLPNIGISHTGISTTNPLMAFGSKLNQGILTQNDFNPALLNNPSSIQNFTTKVSIEQPLFNLDGLYQRKAIKSQLKATEFKTQRAKEYIFFEAEKAYYQLQFAYKIIDVIEVIKKATLENKKLITSYYNQGMLQKSDVLEVELKVLEIENQLQFAKSNLQNASHYLLFFMGDKSTKTLHPSTSLELISLNNNIQSVSKNRADIKALTAATNAYKMMHQSEKSNYLPRLNAFGSYEVNSNKLFNSGTSGYLLGFQLQWNVFNGFKRVGKIQKSKAQFKKATLELEEHVSKSKLEYQKAIRNFADIQHKLTLSKKAVSQSKEALRIKKNRFKQGLEKTTDLLQSEALYAQKLLMYYQAILEFNTSQTYLNFLNTAQSF